MHFSLFIPERMYMPSKFQIWFVALLQSQIWILFPFDWSELGRSTHLFTLPLNRIVCFEHVLGPYHC